MENIYGLTESDLRKLRDIARRVGAGNGSQRPVMRRRRNPGGGGGGTAKASANTWIARVTVGTTGYAPGGIRAAEVSPDHKTLTMFKGKGIRYTVLDVEDTVPNDPEIPNYSEPEDEDAASITWIAEDTTGTPGPISHGDLPEGEDEIELINWVKAPIQLHDRVLVQEVTTRKGRIRNLIVGRDCG